MKLHWSVLPFAAVCVMLFGSTALADTWDDFSYELNDEGTEITITGYTGSSDYVVIPSEIGDTAVTVIGEEAFADCDVITQVEIPEGVTEIGNGSFRDCDGLAAVTLPYTLTNIGEYAFQHCYSLQEISLPEELKVIERNAFDGCGSISELTLPEGLESIGDEAFSGCGSLQSLMLPDDAVFSENTFWGYEGSIYANIDSNAAKEVSRFHKFIAPGYDNVNLGYGYGFDENNDYVLTGHLYASARNADIESALIPEGVTDIDEMGFSDCDSLTEIEIPESVTRIWNWAFQYCDNLAAVTILSDLELGEGVFFGCDNLEYITLPDGVSVTGNIFYGWSGSVYANFGSDAAKSVSLYGRFRTPGNDNVGLQYGYVYNGDSGQDELTGELYASAWESSIDSAEIPEGVTAIIYDGFRYCHNLTEIEIPEGITRIDSWAFQDCGNLAAVTLPSTLTNIGEYAFDDCFSLSEISLPDGLKEIARNAFEDCGSITELILPAGLERIGEEAFSRCSSLPFLTVPDDVRLIGDVFYAYDGRVYANIGTIPSKEVSEYRRFNVPGNDNVGLQYGYEYNENSGQNELTGELYVSAWDSSIESAEIPEGVSAIARDSFNSCNNLTEIEIPEGIARIEGWAFQYCENLAAVTLPSTVTYIGEWAFDNCYNLVDISLPDGLKEIARNAFEDCYSITELILPANLECIGEDAFSWCSGLPSLTVPDDVTLTGDVFYAYDGRVYANIESSVAKEVSRYRRFVAPGNDNVGLQYGYEYNEDSGQYELTGELYVSAWDNSIESAEIPEEVTAIAREGFRCCNSLTEIEIPEGFTRIEDWAFQGCENLAAVTLPSSVTYIGEWAFDDCYNLAEISLPDGLKEIARNAFDDCHSITELILPANLERIGENAFCWCSSLPSLTVPDDVTLTGNVFYGYDGRVYANIGSDAAKEVSRYRRFSTPGNDNVGLQYGYEYNENSGQDELTGELYVSAWDSSIESAEIPEEVTAIAREGFRYCNSLTEIEIPEGITRIEDWAFQDCENLAAVTLPSSVTYIGEWAFDDCYNLIEINLPDGLKEIARNAFDDCHSITELILPSGLESIGEDAFSWCSSLASLTLPDDVTLTGDAFYGYEGRVYANIGSGAAIAVSQYRTFNESSGSFDEVNLRYTFTTGNQVNSLDASAYDTSVPHAAIPTGVTRIAQNGFENCVSLRNVSIPETVTSIEGYAFRNCRALDHLDLPAGLTNIGEYAFSRCTTLHRMMIPDGVTSIPTSTFSGCTQLNEVFIPDSVTAIASTAFPQAHERLVVGCASYARTWAANAGYALNNSSRYCYMIMHRGEETDPAVDPTCLDTGLTEGMHCNACGEILVSQRIVDALGHSWGEPAYAWSEDNGSVTATHICGRDAAHTETETVQTTSVVAKAATCTEMGQTTYTTAEFENNAFEVQTKTETDIPALGHSWGEPAYTWSEDNSSVTATHICERDASHTETETVQTTSAVAKAATCTEMGQTTYTTAEFENSAFEVQIKTETDIPALGHSWGEPAYTWSEDNGSVTATRICERDASHTETETVQTTSTVTKAATCTEMGQTTYTTAEFENSAFEVQIKTETDIPALGHSWGEPSYTWSEDNSSVTATRICERDASHKETETVQTTSAVAKAATCTEKGQTTYTTEEFENSAFEVQIKTETDIPALGHSWGEPAYTWSEDNSSVTATRICERDASHKETETVQTTSAVAKAATCTEKGQTTYTTEEFENSAFEVQTKTETDIPALGHSWCEPSYTWSEDHGSVMATRVCAHNASHKETETVGTAGRELVTSPTETTAGDVRYTSQAFANSAFVVQTAVFADIPALGTLSGLKLPAGTIEIDEEAFMGGSFQYVIVPDGCTTIGERAFADCDELIYICIPEGAELAENAFEDCSADLIIDIK